MKQKQTGTQKPGNQSSASVRKHAAKAGRGKEKKLLQRWFGANRQVRWILLLILLLVFAAVVYPLRPLTPHPYQAGDVVERDIKATVDFFVEDQAATLSSQSRALAAVLTVYDWNPDLSEQLAERIQQAFVQPRQLMEAVAHPAENISTPSIPADTQPLPLPPPDLHDQIWAAKAEFEADLGIKVSDGAYSILEKERFSNVIAQPMNQILTKILDMGVVANKELLLREAEKGIILRNVKTQTEKTVYKLNQFYGIDQAKAMVRIAGAPVLNELSYTLRNLVVDLNQELIQPNITLNRNETEKRKQLAAENVKPVLHKIKAGEMILREGERVSPVQLIKLKASQAYREKDNITVRRFGAALMIGCLLMAFYTLFFQPGLPDDMDHNKKLVLVGVVLGCFFFFSRISCSLADMLAPSLPYAISSSSMAYGIPMAAGVMIICLFTGLRVAIGCAVAMAAAAAVIFQNRFDLFLFFLLHCVMGAYWIQPCRERKVFIKAGLKLGMLNMALVAVIHLYLTEWSYNKLMWDTIFAMIGGISAGVVTAGLAPLVEIAFDFTTDIKLLELANLDRPILRQLMIEAPGTYHHSVVVGTMVEAAASEIGANPLLAKVCGYYHDIGKIRKPLYFIENQRNGKNRHDSLAPSMSALILIAHIKDGVDVARQHKLGQSIADTIRQHHGTSLIRYFYERAKQRKGSDQVNIQDFRYPGPKPQSREAALVMLADVVEAASRTLENPTPSRIRGLVQNLVNKILLDGQLDGCELSLKDLHRIAENYIQILTGIHHHRIEYPEDADDSEAKNGHAHSDRQPAKPANAGPGGHR